MTSRIGYVFWLIVALACGSALAEDGIRWHPELETARKLASQYKVPLLIHFYGDNCLPCKTLEQRVFSKPEVAEMMNQFFICTRINASQDRRTAAVYGVHSWPTDVFVSPDGKTLEQGVCKQDIAGYLGVLQNVAVMNRDRNVMLAANQSQSQTQSSSQAQLYTSAPNSSPSAQTFGQASQVAAGAPTGMLPAPGMGGVASNGSGPGFYPATTMQGNPALSPSLPPNAGVTSGPLLAQDQPHPMTTATHSSANQVAGASNSIPTHTGQTTLPAWNPNAQIPAPHQPQSAGQNLAGLPGVANAPNNQPAVTTSPLATMPNPSGSAAAPFSAMAAQSSTPGLDVSNPYFNAGNTPSAPTAYAANPSSPSIPSLESGFQLPASQSSGPQATTPASTVAFQPRAASTSPEAAANTLPSTTQAFQPSLDGYCPVSLKKFGKWERGNEQHAVKHRGKVYWMASEANVAEFLANPDGSSPTLSGYDAMIFLNEGKLVEGSLQFGLHEEVSGAIFLFSSAENKAAYEANYDRNTQALNTVLRHAGIIQ